MAQDKPVGSLRKIITQGTPGNFFIACQADTGDYGDPQAHLYIFFNDFPAARLHDNPVIKIMLLENHVDNFAGRHGLGRQDQAVGTQFFQ